MKMDAKTLHRHLTETGQNKKLTIEKLPAMAYGKNIEIRLDGGGVLAAHPGLLFKLRGALGHRLLEGACAQAVSAFQNETTLKNASPLIGCKCQPACALHLLYGTHPIIDDNGHHMQMASPFTLSARPQGTNLIINLLLAGFAGAWHAEIRLALIQALNGDDLPWTVMAKDCQVQLIPERLKVSSSKILKISVEPRLAELTKQINQNHEEERIELRLVFLSGIEINNRKTPLCADDILARLVDRPVTLAPWFGCSFVPDREEIHASWQKHKKNSMLTKLSR